MSIPTDNNIIAKEYEISKFKNLDIETEKM